MKKLLIIYLLIISTHQINATVPLSGRQFDFFITKSEYQIVRTIYFRWTFSWGGNPRIETASTMYYMMFGCCGKGLRLTPGEIAMLDLIDKRVISRANSILKKQILP